MGVMKVKSRVSLAVCYFCFPVLIGCVGGSDMKQSDKVVRMAHGSGRWFSGTHDALISEVEGYIERAEVPDISEKLIGVIAPHAGYVYSGPVAGYSFRALRDSAAKFGSPETVVILGLSHSGGFSGVALMDGDAVSTPISKTALDVEAGQIMAGMSERIRFEYSPHLHEHSAENQIPFVQVALPDAKLVVGLIGDHDKKTRRELVDALQKLAEKRDIVVVASTDLLHDADYELVSDTDRGTLSKIAALDMDGLAKTWSFEHQVCCGIAPVLTLMEFAETQGVESGSILRYRNSGDDHPESRGAWVVGYGAVSF